ncbi:MAG: 3'(2'),5'-bisphosphate nucleotidase CysQ [Paracoccaceae bacterium]|nr:3'(2'),5'-bisphosphate nucleotidase CysQ [Paracoccaceae bacterium]MDE2912848.1 3'(2'),5'-bisphosphate nucleotidase CysQ [Paracoccaceae bacterium]
MDPERICRTMIDLALAAGAGILTAFQSGDVSARHKPDSSPVTEADLAADRLISNGLGTAFPGVRVVSEERQESHKSGSGSFFIVDPLDGTRSFVSGNRDFTVNIAWVENTMPVHGVVFAPAYGQLFFTWPDGTSEEIRMDPEAEFIAAAAGTINGNSGGRTLAVSNPDNDALVVIASRSHRNPRTSAYIGKYDGRIGRTCSAGSSLKFCLLAAGEADLYPRLGPTMEWDTAAGQAVLANAGGKVFALDTMAPLTYGKHGYHNPEFVAFSPGVQLYGP